MLVRSQSVVTVSEIAKPLPGICGSEVSMSVPDTVVRLASRPLIVWVKLKVASPPVVFLMSLMSPRLVLAKVQVVVLPASTVMPVIPPLPPDATGVESAVPVEPPPWS